MNFRYPSDAIVPLHRDHHHVDDDGYDRFASASRDTSPSSMPTSGDDGAGAHGRLWFAGQEAHSPTGIMSRHDAVSSEPDGDHHATPSDGIGSGSGNSGLGSGSIQSGGNTAGHGGDGYSYGGIVHASILIYEPINISVSVGYGSVALAQQTNDVNVDQSAFQMAGVGGDGGNGNIATGGGIGGASTGSAVIATGGSSAGNGGDGYFSGALVDAPVVIYHPVNIAVAGPGGTAYASQSNAVDINQSAVQIAGVGGSGGNGNVAGGGSVITLDPAWGSSNGGNAWHLVETGGSQAGNGGDGSFSGELVHTSFVLYDPINIAVAGYNSSAYAIQTNSVYVDQSALQIAGIGGHGGNGNVAMGGSLVSHSLWGGSDAIATGANGAGNGGSGHSSGNLIDVSVAIYAPINIAIAGPHSTAIADQTNDVHIDQSAVQIAGVGGDGGHGNLALGGDLATHLLPDLHLMA
ncbi:hypothetical protein Q2941_24900 [Bradyrhizobium sp. UFLA05-153]